MDPELGNVVLNRSLQTTSLMDIALKEAQEAIYNVLPDEDGRNMLSIKELCHCRFYDLPPVPEFHKPSVGLIRSADLGRLVQFSGTVLRTGSVASSSLLFCRSRCWKRRRNLSVRTTGVVAASR